MMTIRLQCALVLILVCAGGMLLTGWIALSFSEHSERRQLVGPDSIAQQQAVRLRELGGQFLLTADLVVGSGESFLADGNRRQHRQAVRLLDEIARMDLAAGVGSNVRLLQGLFARVSQIVEDASGAVGADREEFLGEQVVVLDDVAAELMRELAILAQGLSSIALQRAQALDVEEDAMHDRMLWSFIAYLLLLLLVWRFQVRALVDPVVELSVATERARIHQTALGVTPSGPKETRRMTVSISQLFDWLRSENQRIEEVVKLRTSELIAADNAKDEFLATITHELRTPLNGVIGMLDVLTSESLSDEQREAAQVASASSQHLMRLIDDILDITKIVAGRMQLESVPVEVRDLVSNVVACMQPIAQGKSVALSAEVSDEVALTILSDPLRLRQVLFNLVGNAIKFTDEGGVQIRVRTRSRDAEVGVLEFCVSDTGIGMQTAAVETLFEPFVQADSSMTRQYGGSGLGLAISRRLVDLFGGSIEVESVFGSGSTFRVLLPYTESADGVQQLEPPEGVVDEVYDSGVSRRVLVVDDNSVNQLVAQRMLESAGYDVDVTDNGRRAVDQAMKVAYGAVLMDLQMPVMGGVEAMHELRAMENAGELPLESRFPLPVLALTANTLAVDEPLEDHKGFNEILTKPIRRDKLLAAVGRYCPLPQVQKQ